MQSQYITLSGPRPAPGAARTGTQAVRLIVLPLVAVTVLGMALAIASLRSSLGDVCEQDGLVVCGP